MALVLLLALIGLGVWWFLRPSATAPGKTTAAPAPAKLASVRIVAPPAQVEAPKAPAVPAHAEAAADSAATSADPQADLKTAIPDLARLARNGDGVILYETYTPPDKIDPQVIKTLQATRERLDNLLNELSAEVGSVDPARLQQVQQEQQQMIQQSHDRAAQRWESLEAQTPTFNAAGDEATYMADRAAWNPLMSKNMAALATPLVPIVFLKINGKWYLEPGAPSDSRMEQKLPP